MIYFRDTGNPFWNNTTNWSDTDGGDSNGRIPTVSDDVKLTSISRNKCFTDDTVPAKCKTLDCPGYTGELKIGSAGLQLGENHDVPCSLGLSPTMTITGTGVLVLDGNSANIWSVGVKIPILSLRACGAGITLNDLLNVGTLDFAMNSFAASTSFIGLFGFIADSVILTNLSWPYMTFKGGLTYRIGTLVMNGKGTDHATINSSPTNPRAKITATGSVIVSNVNFSNIDASEGRTIYTFNGVVTNCVNVNSFSDKVDPVSKTTSSVLIM
jgi:hypothetical protein